MPWLLSTIGAFIFTYLLGWILAFGLTPGSTELISEGDVLAYVVDHPLMSLTAFAFGIGGYLLVRYILEKRPDISSNNEV